MNGTFLSDLSGGIFSRLQELNQQQKAKDDQQKLETLNLLASLSDRVEPESLPALMSHMGDVIGVKGKLKDFWSAFSGMPDRSIGDQLGTQLRDITNQMVGPQEATQAREAYKQNLLQPYREAGTRPRTVAGLNYQNPPDLQEKIVFRDPRQEIEANQQFQEKLLNDRLQQQSWIEEQKERLRATIEEKKQKAADEKLLQQQRLAFSKDLGDQIKFYRANGVKDPGQARRLALNDYSDMATQLGIRVPPLMMGDNDMLDKVRAQIDRLQRQGSGVGNGASWWRQPQLRTWVEYRDKNGQLTRVEASQVKVDSLTGKPVLPDGAIFERIYTEQPPIDGTSKQQGVGGVSNNITPELIQGSIDNEIKKGTPLPEIVKKLRSLPTYGANKEMFEGAIRSRNLEGASKPGPIGRYVESLPKGVVDSVAEGLVNRGLGGAPGMFTPSTSGASVDPAKLKEAELNVMRNEINWLKTRRDEVQKQLQIAPGVVQRSEMENVLKDLDRRIEYAETQYQKASTVPYGYIQR